MTDTYDPTAQVPDGIVLDRDTYDALMAAWAANGGVALTDAEVEAITGAALAAPTIKRSFPTGLHPDAARSPFGGRF